MKVSLEREFPVAAPADKAWELLRDIERVAACMPGARISERLDERHYKGTVSVRFGPANLSFRGEVELSSIEPAKRTLRLIGKGTDTSGSGASLDLTTLRGTHPALIERSGDEILDSWIFAGGRELIDCVFRAGERLVTDGRHRDREALAARYARALHKLRA